VDAETQEKIEAATLRRLLTHLQSRTDVQNIDLMILANFCRNCLARWYREAAGDEGVSIEDAEARTHIYGMPYDTWKAEHQTPATPAQLAAMDARRR